MVMKLALSRGLPAHSKGRDRPRHPGRDWAFSLTCILVQSQQGPSVLGSGGLGTLHMPGDHESSREMECKYRILFTSSHLEGARTCWLGEGDAERAWSTYCLHDWRGSHA